MVQSRYGKFMTVAEYSKITGLSKANTYLRISKGKIPVFKYSDKLLIPKSILEEVKGGQAI